MGERLGVTQQQIARWEKADGDIKSAALVKIAKALGVTVAYLLGVDVDDDGKLTFRDDRTTELDELFNSMEPESRDALMVVARALACASQGARTEH